MRRLALLFVGSLACSHVAPHNDDHALALRAYVDEALDALSSHVEERVAACSSLPPRTPEMRECLGPVASQPDALDELAVEVRRLQLALFLALAEGRDPGAELRALEVVVRRLSMLLSEVTP